MDLVAKTFFFVLYRVLVPNSDYLFNAFLWIFEKFPMLGLDNMTNNRYRCGVFVLAGSFSFLRFCCTVCPKFISYGVAGVQRTQ